MQRFMRQFVRYAPDGQPYYDSASLQALCADEHAQPRGFARVSNLHVPLDATNALAASMYSHGPTLPSVRGPGTDSVLQQQASQAAQQLAAMALVPDQRDQGVLGSDVNMARALGGGSGIYGTTGPFSSRSTTDGWLQRLAPSSLQGGLSAPATHSGLAAESSRQAARVSDPADDAVWRHTQLSLYSQLPHLDAADGCGDAQPYAQVQLRSCCQ